MQQYDYGGLIQPLPAHNKAADDLLEANGVTGEFLIAACAGVDKKYDRRYLSEWPLEHWITASQKLAKRWPIVLIGSRAAPQVLQAIGGNAVDLGGKTSLPVLAALCGKAKLAISADGGVLHLAAAMKTPVVGLYGPTDSQLTGPRGVPNRIVRLPLECAPCLLNRCKWRGDDEQKCMKQISPDMVVQAVHEVIGL